MNICKAQGGRETKTLIGVSNNNHSSNIDLLHRKVKATADTTLRRINDDNQWKEVSALETFLVFPERQFMEDCKIYQICKTQRKVRIMLTWVKRLLAIR